MTTTPIVVGNRDVGAPSAVVVVIVGQTEVPAGTNEPSGSVYVFVPVNVLATSVYCPTPADGAEMLTNHSLRSRLTE